MKTFKSLNDLVWWLQNNGGGEVKITVSPSTGNDAVQIKLLDADGNHRDHASGRFLKDAVTNLNGEGA